MNKEDTTNVSEDFKIGLEQGRKEVIEDEIRFLRSLNLCCSDETTYFIPCKLPCLHCGEVFDIDKEFHFCNAKKLEWLNKQKDAVLILPNGKVFNLKNNGK